MHPTCCKGGDPKSLRAMELTSGKLLQSTGPWSLEGAEGPTGTLWLDAQWTELAPGAGGGSRWGGGSTPSSPGWPHPAPLTIPFPRAASGLCDTGCPGGQAPLIRLDVYSNKLMIRSIRCFLNTLSGARNPFGSSCGGRGIIDCRALPGPRRQKVPGF